MSFGQDESQGNSAPTGTPQYQQYFAGLNSLTGGKLGSFAKTGTTPLTTEQIQALGGGGATRTADVERARGQAIDQLTADPNLNVDQRLRATQLTNQDAQSRLDAINKESEAALTGAAQYNNQLNASDLQLLAQIFYGGKGQISEQSSSGTKGSFWG